MNLEKFFTSKKGVAVVFAAIFLLHTLSIVYTWYLTVWWMDILLHLAGGAWSAMVIFYFLRGRGLFESTTYPIWLTVLLVAGIVMLIGVFWEWFEFGFDYMFARYKAELRAQLGLVDTMGDLLADLIGGITMALYVIKKRHIKQIYFHD